MRVAASTPKHMLTDTVTVERKTTAPDSGGFPKETWSSHLTGVKSALQPLSTAKAGIYGADRAKRMMTMFTAPGQDITTKDRIVVTEDRTGGDVTRRYRVEGVSDLVVAGVLLEIDLEQIDATP